MNTYFKFCYQIIGKHLDERNIGASLGDKLYQADMHISPGMFLSAWGTGVIIAIIILTSIFSILNVMLGLEMSFFPEFNSSNPAAIMFSPFFILTTLVIVTIVALPFSITSKIQNKRIAIDRELPFVLSHMSIIASTGAPPLAIFYEISDGKHGVISEEFKKMVNEMDIEGIDIIQAITNLARNTPSLLLRSLLIDLTKLVHTGGNLEVYFYDRLRNLMELKRQIQREFTQSLSFYAEIYVSLILMSTLIGILFAVLGGMVMGGRIGPFSAEMFYKVFIYFVVPMTNIVFAAILMIAFSRSG
ncbi:MAG: type II secretion system F family protein [Candidatus Syntropharchaeales archaeon]